jgi:hypothetical protein
MTDQLDLTEATDPDVDDELAADALDDDSTGEIAVERRPWRPKFVRRVRAWWERPWTDDRIVKFACTVVALGVTTYIMTNVVHLSLLPGRDLVFDDTTPTGGDFGAHVWGPAFLRDHLIGSFRLNGWSMDWYAGLPVYRFYMVLPAIGVLIADTILPYGVALKLVSVLGLVTLPAACWAFGRLGDFKYPMPELFAFAGLSFALDESFSIYGGNLKSTMAGEFSFSIALSIAVLALGVLAAGLRTGKYRVWAPVLIAAACVSHGIVLIYVAVSAVIFCVIWIDRQRVKYVLTTGLTSLLLLAWWVLPFLWDHDYQTDMKYGAETNWWQMYFPLTAPLDFIITTLAVIGFVFAVVKRQLNGAALGVIGLVFVAFVYLAKDSLPGLGLLWNPRVLPWLYLVRYLLMMIGAFELLTLFWNAIRDRRANETPSTIESTALAAIPALSVLLVLGFMFQELPGDGTKVLDDGTSVYAWGPITATATNTDAQGDGWSRYNFLGYEGRGAQYTEYRNVVLTMEGLGDDPAHGCGRALWENNSDNGQYGTTMALMLLPFWTDGCIGSMEGLFFEASGTTPYHFIATAAMSEQSSNPVRELRYTNNDASVGVPQLQALGVRYAMVRTEAAKNEAAGHPDLTLVAESGPWEIYEVADSEVVVPLAVQPVVVNEREGDRRERLLELGTSWFQQPDEWSAMPANDGPDSWQRIDVVPDPNRRLAEGEAGGPRVDIVVPAQPIEPVPLPEVTVSNVEIEQQSLSFDVDQVGVPVLVKVSYFPNWNASGADGPYRIGPNMMVVVPTDTSVELSYGRSGIDYLAYVLTLIGIGLCVQWRREGDFDFDSPVPSFATVGADDELADAGLDGDTGLDSAADLDTPDPGVGRPDHVDQGDGEGDDQAADQGGDRGVDEPVGGVAGDGWDKPPGGDADEQR